MTLEDLHRLLGKYASTKKAAEQMGVSDSLFKRVLQDKVGRQEAAPAPSVDLVKFALERYQSVKFAARMLMIKESYIRKMAETQKWNLATMVRYDLSTHNNAKGRRAELYWASTRGSSILEDCNITEGSQAEIDFIDFELGRVNVKSSKRYSFRAQTRKANPHYWKYSAKGLDYATTLAAVGYDEQMEDVVFHANFEIDKYPQLRSINTFTIQLVNGQAVLSTEDKQDGL